MIHKSLQLISIVVFVSVVFTLGCSAQTEQQALQQLRELTKDGKLPSEQVVANIETRFAGKKTGALAKLLHARIKFENKDFGGAAALLNSDEFAKRTSLGDYALWLRGRALQNATNHTEAMTVLAKLTNDFPNSIRGRDSKLLWATSAIASGQP